MCLLHLIFISDTLQSVNLYRQATYDKNNRCMLSHETTKFENNYLKLKMLNWSIVRVILSFFQTLFSVNQKLCKSLKIKIQTIENNVNWIHRTIQIMRKKSYTKIQTLYFPSILCVFPSPKDTFLLYIKDLFLHSNRTCDETKNNSHRYSTVNENLCACIFPFANVNILHDKS